MISVPNALSQNAALRLPFDPSLIPDGLEADQARIAFYNPLKATWEVLDNTTVEGNSLVAEVSHFSLYKPVLLLPDREAVLQEIYVYPNPAASPDDPTLHVKMGQAQEVQITIYDIAGQVAHSATINQSPQIVNGEYVYEYTWSDPKASGVYFAIVHGKTTNNEVVKGKTKFAVVK